MGSIADKLTYLQETKTAIKNAIIAKGVTVNDTDTFRSYADKVASIEGGTLKESTFTGYIAQSGSNNVLPTILQPVYGNEFKGLMKINNSNSDKRKFILDSTFKSGTDGTLEAFIHYIHNPNIAGHTGILSVGAVHWKACYFGTHYASSTEVLPFWALGNNGSSWSVDERPFPEANLIEHPEVYFKFIVAPTTVGFTVYDADKTTILGEKTVEMDTTPNDNKIILFNNWDLSHSGGGYANAGTIDLSDSYIKINDTVVQGILK